MTEDDFGNELVKLTQKHFPKLAAGDSAQTALYMESMACTVAFVLACVKQHHGDAAANRVATHFAQRTKHHVPIILNKANDYAKRRG